MLIAWWDGVCVYDVYVCIYNRLEHVVNNNDDSGRGCATC